MSKDKYNKKERICYNCEEILTKGNIQPEKGYICKHCYRRIRIIAFNSYMNIKKGIKG